MEKKNYWKGIGGELGGNLRGTGRELEHNNCRRPRGGLGESWKGTGGELEGWRRTRGELEENWGPFQSTPPLVDCDVYSTFFFFPL